MTKTNIKGQRWAALNQGVGHKNYFIFMPTVQVGFPDFLRQFHISMVKMREKTFNTLIGSLLRSTSTLSLKIMNSTIKI